MCLKRCLVDVLITYLNLPKARREVKMGVEVCIHYLVEGVIHTRE
jgi:hypothetical protein